MKFTFWLRNKTARAARSQPARARLRLEALEERTVPTTFTVTNLADSGAGSLRQAVLDANAHPGPDTIDFKPGLHGTIGLTSGQLSITDDLTVAGPGAHQLTVSGSHASRVFDVGNAATVTIAGLTIADGHVTGDESTTLGGGGILNEAGSTLKLQGDTLRDNTATASSDTVDVFGGGLLNEGTATVTSCTFSGNQALGGGGGSFFGGSVGGGIDNFGGATLTVTGSTFTANQALSSGSGNFGIGGAIENNAGLDLTHPSTATISSSLFTGNLAGGINGTGTFGQGGAIDTEGPGSSLTLSNSTVRANQAGEPTVSGSIGLGGGLLAQSGSTTTIVDSTISDNLGVAGFGGYVNGGGILQFNQATMSLINSAVVGNRALGGAGATGVGLLVGEGLGGGIMNATSTLTLVDSTVADNQAVGGNAGTATTQDVEPGAALGGGIENYGNASGGSTLTLLDSTVSGNLAQGGSTNQGIGGVALGGGIHNQSSTVNILGSSVVDNQVIGGDGASGFGPGLASGGGLETSEFPGIPSGDLGSAGGPASASVIDSVFSGNQAIGGIGGNAVGGGINVGFPLGFLYPSLTDHSTLTLTGSTLDHNLAQGGNGGKGANGGDGLGGGLAIQPGASATASDSTITHNKALGGEEGKGGSDGHGLGGGVYHLGTFVFDALTVIKKNHASTAGDNLYP